ncbi:interferon gamma receptor 2 [Rhineura floridana]|uniref:interferon gamma receptor 2 n=1 Tax=Rhineura floridana TaxID=261503 RepID=UPI002AC7EDFF|nr:interferon gamma receptor 2 [Rhineura floridana]
MRRLDVLLVLLFLGKPLLGVAVTESSFFLSAPQNLTIQSYNFDNVLKWSPVKGINGSVSYSVEWRFEHILNGKENWEKVNCTSITKPECDFNHGKDHYIIILRVRAEQGELKSAWTETSLFQARSNTILGPPRAINISSEGNILHVSFLPPFEHIGKPVDFEYIIYFWEKSISQKLTNSGKNRRKTFRDLKERTVYCFQVQAVLLRINLTGQRSEPYCKETTVTDATRILYVSLIYGSAVFALIAIFGCMIVIRKYRHIIKSLWKPPLTIPSHYEEDLQNIQMITVEEFQNCAGEDYWDSVSEISNAEQKQAVTNDFPNENQVHSLKVEEHR